MADPCDYEVRRGYREDRDGQRVQSVTTRLYADPDRSYRIITREEQWPRNWRSHAEFVGDSAEITAA